MDEKNPSIIGTRHTLILLLPLIFVPGVRHAGMPHGQDIEDDTGNLTSKYECLECGTIVESETHPGQCSDCGSDFQNRAKSLE